MLAIILILNLFVVFVNSNNEKRLVLHSEFDIAQEFANVNNKIVNLTTVIAEKEKEIISVNAKLNELTAAKDKEIEALKKAFEENKGCGSTYVRWGRTTCATNGTELVYSGFMASSSHGTTGGGSNYLCISPDPQWSYYDESIESLAKLKGVEYQFYAHYADGAAKFFGHNVLDDDATCAVCHCRRGSSLMIPGRTDCYNGWTKEYSGYLVSEYDNYAHESEFICLDDRPESVVGGHDNDDESVLYFVEASCGKSLECPPYINGREITCVVCTK
ncbi:uncharacterized protein LOC132735234 [Ruditapes philippinarum]|uniref:uncharacterized protein LOC132735234 n=1 Tax=Ruditapes philippinarum TaxID=129788 RepID=UPI00295BA1C2|nr:uncharacterized protein LOC132735234 [Ruditapes philippinarum]